MIFIAVFSALCSLGGQAALTAEGISNLRLLHVVFRHGDRAPISLYPNDPYINFTFPPNGLGQLTLDGYMHQYQAGQFLRQRYDQFLGENYHPDVVAVHTTAVDRVVMSAQLQMAGMWPPSPHQRWHTDLSWQPFSIAVEGMKNDALIEVTISCPPYDKELEIVVNSTEVQKIIDDNKALMQYVEEKSGEKIRTLEDLGKFYVNLLAEETYGLELPEWTRKGDLMDKMEKLTAIGFTLFVKTPLLKRLKGGPLLNKILKDSKAAASKSLNPERRTVFLYGGHDTTIVNLLSTLDVWEPQVPVYGITVLFEVHEDPKTDEYGLKVFLRNTTGSAEPQPLQIPHCGFWCPLQQLEKLYADVLPDDIEMECKSNDLCKK